MTEPFELESVRRAMAYVLSPVHQAVETDDVAELTRLLDNGHDPDEFDNYSGWTPLLRAIDGEADAAVRLLQAHGGEPQLNG